MAETVAVIEMPELMDLSAAFDVREQLSEHMQYVLADPDMPCVIDMEDVRILSVPGAQLLYSVFLESAKNDRRFLLHSVQSQSVELLQQIGLGALLEGSSLAEGASV